MKTTTYTLLFVLCIFATVCKAQPTGISCTPNTFWAINPFSTIEEFQLNNGTVTDMGVASSNAPGQGLAFSAGVSGGNFSPTFYTSNDNYGFYYDGARWDTLPGKGGGAYSIGNCGGSYSSLYFFDNSSTMKIFKHNGTSYDSVYFSTAKCTVADIAVDDAGNIWGFTGLDTLGAIMTNSIDVISPAGQLIKQYPTWLNTNNAYGCMMLNGTLYIGLGESNPVHPSTLLPISIRNDSAIVGTAISFHSNSFSDMASCNAGSPLYAPDIKPLNTSIALSPNPVANVLNITLPSPFAFSIYNMMGQQVYYNKEKKNNISIDVSTFPDGIYFLCIETGLSISGNKFIVQH